MKVEQKDLGKSKYELTVELPWEELAAYTDRAVERLSQEVKIEGFRPGKATYEVLKQKVGELAILEEAARLAVNKTLDKVLLENLPRQAVGQPMISISKLAPENPLEYKVEVNLLPEVKLGQYKDLGIKKTEVKVEEEEITKVFGELSEMRAKEILSEEAITDTGKAIVDIQMYLDKVPVEGGQGKDVAILLGKNYVVPGFDQKIIGAKKGDVREFGLHYPETHHQKNLAGKMVEFKVTVKEVYQRELPAINDDFAKTFGMKTAEELKKTLTDNLVHEKEEKELQKQEIELLNKIVDASKFGDIAEELVTAEADTMFHELEHNLQDQGGKIEDYLQSVKKSKPELLLEMMPGAMKRVKTILTIREIGIVESIKVEAKEVDEHVEKLLEQYKGNREVEERVKTVEYKSYLFNFLTNQKIVNTLKDWNIK